MTITKAHAQRLAQQGKATIEDCCTVDGDGRRWRIVTRHDVQRVDHYRERD